MLGWQIIIFREQGTGRVTDQDTIASWLTGIGGTDWLDEMVAAGQAELVAGNGGYPNRYAALWQDLFPAMLIQPQPYKGPLVIGEGYTMPRGWCDTMNLNREAFARCQPGDRMFIHCWDQS